jgi:nicotinate dehydrogenase subunit B
MAIRAPSSQAVKTIISQGLHAPNNLGLRDMPSFSDDLSTAQMDEMAQYLRERYASDLDAWPAE